MTFSLVEAAQPAVQRDEVDVGLHGAGIHAQRRLLFGDGLIQAAHALEIRAAANVCDGPQVQRRDLAAQRIVQRRHSGPVLVVERELLS